MEAINAMGAVKEPLNLNEITGYNEAQKNKKKDDPNKLDNTAFMRLFLEQLKNQDPTSPMETDKIITQTAQLTQVEMQEQTKQTMIKVAEAMESTKVTNEELKNFQAEMKTALDLLVKSIGAQNLGESHAAQGVSGLDMIGKIAETKINGLNLAEGARSDFELFFDEPISLNGGIPKILVMNEGGEIVREIDISAYTGKSGYLRFGFDGKDSNGQNLPSGAYSVIAHYNFNADGTHNLARIGRGEVQSVIFDGGKAHLRLGELVVPFDDALEFYAR